MKKYLIILAAILVVLAGLFLRQTLWSRPCFQLASKALGVNVKAAKSDVSYRTEGYYHPIRS